MITVCMGRYATFRDALKFLDSKDFIKLLNANEIELCGNFEIKIIHNDKWLDYELPCYEIILEVGKKQ